MWMWLALAVIAAIGEVLTFDLFLASVAAAALVVAVVALVLPPVFQVSLFAALSLVGTAFIRPAIKRALGIEAASDPGMRSHPSVVGRRATVTHAVDAHGGQIRIGDGEFWTARSFDLTETIVAGETVNVVLVDGLTALVESVSPMGVELPVRVAIPSALREKGA
jgi:membrane protein implicated in regulation of membrane protease activity